MDRGTIARHTFWLPSLFWAAVVVLAALGNLPHNPLTPSLHVRSLIRAFTCQGWAFFTRDPRLPEDHFGLVQQGGSVTPLDLHGASAAALFGIQKDRRLKAHLLQTMVKEQLEKSKGLEEKAPQGFSLPTRPLAELPVAVKATPRGFEELCGTYLVKHQAPVPWGYRSPELVRMPATFLLLKVTCS